MSKKGISQRYSFYDLFGTKENCDQIKSLYEYFQELLSKEEQEKFGQHLVGCPVCAKTLAELNECKEISERTILDGGKADRIFRQNRAQIGNRLNKKYGGGIPVVPAVWKFRFPAYANAMLLLLIGLLIYPAYRSFILDREVRQLQNELASSPDQKQATAPQQAQPSVSLTPEPLVSTSFVFPIRAERDVEQKIIRIPFDTNNRAFTLLFSFPSDNFESYVLKIDRQNQNVWRKEVQADRGEISQLTAVTLQSGYFREGTYQLEVSGSRGKTITRLSVYKLILTP